MAVSFTAHVKHLSYCIQTLATPLANLFLQFAWELIAYAIPPSINYCNFIFRILYQYAY